MVSCRALPLNQSHELWECCHITVERKSVVNAMIYSISNSGVRGPGKKAVVWLLLIYIYNYILYVECMKPLFMYSIYSEFYMWTMWSYLEQRIWVSAQDGGREWLGVCAARKVSVSVVWSGHINAILSHSCPFLIGWLIHRGAWLPLWQQVNDDRWLMRWSIPTAPNTFYDCIWKCFLGSKQFKHLLRYPNTIWEAFSDGIWVWLRLPH